MHLWLLLTNIHLSYERNFYQCVTGTSGIIRGSTYYGISSNVRKACICMFLKVHEDL